MFCLLSLQVKILHRVPEKLILATPIGIASLPLHITGGTSLHLDLYTSSLPIPINKFVSKFTCQAAKNIFSTKSKC